MEWMDKRDRSHNDVEELENIKLSPKHSLVEVNSMNRVVHFDILADEPEKLIDFYGKVFGWTFTKWEGPMDYWMISTGEGEGIDGGLTRKSPQSNNANTIGIEDLDATIEKVEENGGTIITPKMAIPGVGWFALFKDTEDNMFGLMQEDPEAS
jgi:predicted enzyme related to lactoylglutathione lyase